MICRDTPTHGWVSGWMGVSVGQWVWLGHITKYQINLDLIEIIQFCLNIYDLLDILDIFLDILLKPPQPHMGLFFYFYFRDRCRARESRGGGGIAVKLFIYFFYVNSVL